MEVGGGKGTGRAQQVADAERQSYEESIGRKEKYTTLNRHKPLQIGDERLIDIVKGPGIWNRGNTSTF
jgi:hypothetical protein